MSVDVRSRTDSAAAPITGPEFFRELLPAALAANPALVAAATRQLPLPDLIVAVEDDSWRLSTAGEQVLLGSGESTSEADWHLSSDQLSEIVLDRVTPIGLHASGKLSLRRRTLPDLLNWWLLLRSVLDQRAAHTPGSVTFADRNGGALDLRRSFRITDASEDLRWFLEQAGYLHIQGVFSAQEMAEIAADMDRAAPQFQPDDGRSWWARTADGQQRVVRMQGFDLLSPATARLLDDPRIQGIGELSGDGHKLRDETGNRIEALFKPIGVTQGISDVPWHKDCSLGRHSYDCCSITIGVSITGADAESGQLRVLAGSHRALIWPARRQPDIDLPDIALPTRTGDLTVHLSCTMHMAQPPVQRERRVLYTSLRLPARDAAELAARRQLIDDIREAAPRTVSQPSTIDR